ncbi:glucosaminidase domain-containing protein [Paucilactobacillus kaifaensis]|uniref:glucosaminidase domain-containing protein n=1 Tax=Paucilactobacillus kaifaensis TaxID=2559921 RepID=UPI0039C8EA4D
MLKRGLKQVGIIILVCGWGLSWSAISIVGAEITQTQMKTIRDAAVATAEQDFNRDYMMSIEELHQQDEQFQLAYKERYRSIQTEFDSGVSYVSQMQAQQIKIDVDELAKAESYFFMMGVKHKYGVEKNSDQLGENIPNKEIAENDMNQQAVSSIDASIEESHDNVNEPQRQPKIESNNGVEILPRGVITLDHQKFIQQFAETARIVAQEHNLYASVMIAQAVLESSWGQSGLSQAPFYNLFGVKGSFAGKSVLMKTNEDDGSGRLFAIRGQFRHYPSYRASLDDYAKVLLQPFFSKAWKSNTTSFADATSALTGTYATDTGYAAKLNQIILTYDLTKYDQMPSKVEQPNLISHRLKEREPYLKKRKLAKTSQNARENSKIMTILGWVGLGASGWWVKRRV